MENEDALTKEQSAHRAEVTEEVTQLIWDKYTKGAQEHKTNLKQDSTVGQLVDWAIEEALDQLVYLVTLKSKMGEK